MINLKNYILEGGHAVPSQPIPAEISLKLYNDIRSIIIKNAPFLRNKIVVLGSVGKKPKGEFNGDIDIAVEYDKTKFEKILNIIFPNVEYAKAGLPNIISINYEYRWKEEDRKAQVDFMMVDNIEWAEFIYHSPDFTKNESKYKASLRNHLLSIMISEIPVDELPELDDNDNIKTKWKYSLNFATGIVKQFLDFRGRNGLLKNPKKVKELEKQITNNKKDFIDFIFDNGTTNDFNSLESVWNALHNKYKYKNKIKDIEKRFYNEVLKNNIK